MGTDAPRPEVVTSETLATVHGISARLVALARETGAPQFARAEMSDGTIMLLVAGTASQVATLEEAICGLQDAYVDTHRKGGAS
jgi:hypothetical protein